MWERTAESLPPKHEVLAVVHRVFGPTGGEAHEEAIWDGENWTRRRDKEVLHKNYYYQWRRLET